MTNKHLFSRLLKKANNHSSLILNHLYGLPHEIAQRYLFGVQSVVKNLRNPWLINDLRACKELYNCRETITDVMDSLQIRPFLTNKANFRKSQMNVNKAITKDYTNKTLGQRGKNKANSKPNKANFQKAKMNVNKVLLKDYENILNWAISENKPNFNPKQTQSKPISKQNIDNCLMIIL